MSARSVLAGRQRMPLKGIGDGAKLDRARCSCRRCGELYGQVRIEQRCLFGVFRGLRVFSVGLLIQQRLCVTGGG
jgi:hypothetical protein